jgi:hypothetical protein
VVRADIEGAQFRPSPLDGLSCVLHGGAVTGVVPRFSAKLVTGSQRPPTALANRGAGLPRPWQPVPPGPDLVLEGQSLPRNVENSLGRVTRL